MALIQAAPSPRAPVMPAPLTGFRSRRRDDSAFAAAGVARYSPGGCTDNVDTGEVLLSQTSARVLDTSIAGKSFLLHKLLAEFQQADSEKPRAHQSLQ